MKRNATIAARNRPAVDPRLTYALVNRDKPLFVKSVVVGVTQTQIVTDAKRFEGKWLADTCWSWQMFWTPVEWNQAQARYKAIENQKPKIDKNETKNRTNTRSVRRGTGWKR